MSRPELSVEIPAEPVSPKNDGTPKSPKSPHSPFRVKETQAMSLGWQDLSFEVTVKQSLFSKASQKQIVKNSSGMFKPGTLTALMGPSGAGKTTMMNVLAGRAPYGEITSGKVLLNGLEANPVDYQRQLAYVMQQDAMFATQTPREALRFTAALRLPEYSEDEREEIINSAISALLLDKCADTMIGSVMIPGLSGGEKKRTAVAIELISSPSLIFLDEPTSGLDSHSAHELVLILRSLAESGCTIVCTIHQPSSEVFDLFHRAIFLHSGNIVYDGDIEGVAAHFETEDESCGDEVNPADFAMQRLQTMSEDEVPLLRAKTPKYADMSGRKMQKADLKKAQVAGLATQMAYLIRREFLQVTRDKITLVARYGMGIFLSLLIGCIFYDVGDEWGGEADAATKIQNHWGGLVFSSINAMFLAAQPMILAFPLQRAAFIREYATGTYSAPAYLVAKSLVDIPACILQQVLVLLVFYFLTSMNANFAYLLGGSSLLAVTSASLALVLGASTTAAETAMNLLPALYIPQIMFCGFFVKSENIPVFLRWLQWCCPLKYGVNLVTIAEFTESVVPDNRHAQVSALIQRGEINRDDWWISALILGGMFIGFRILACIILAKRARSFQ